MGYVIYFFCRILILRKVLRVLILSFYLNKANIVSTWFQAADIWALGITLYSLVYGQVPFHDDNIISLYDKICSQDLVFPEEPSTSPELKDIITKMLIKESVDRMKLIDIKNHEWLTQYGQFSTDLCYRFVEVSEAEIKSSVKTMPKLNTLLTVKSMIQNRSFSMATGKRKSSQSSKEC